MVWLNKKIYNIFFCGICGISLSSLAMFAMEIGYKVYGSDISNSQMKIKLRDKGIIIYDYHDVENLKNIDLFVYSSAIGEDNIEYIEAKNRNIYMLSRAEFFGLILKNFSNKIGISGTHGKSTVTGMIASIFKSYDNTVSIFAGAESSFLKNGNYEYNGNKNIIYEACEYKKSFLHMKPTEAVILNIEKEHIDCYPTLKDSLDAFKEFYSESNIVYYNFDDENIIRMLGDKTNKISYSIKDSCADVYADKIQMNKDGCSFTVKSKFIKPFEIQMKISGLFNISNALAAISVSLNHGIDKDIIINSLKNFDGMDRRFTLRGYYKGAPIYDDYAHHPSEIKATLLYAKTLGYKNVICIFQPHTYSRTYAFQNDFIDAFSEIKEVIYMDIYSAREINTYDISSSDLVLKSKNGKYMPNTENIVNYIKDIANSDTLFLFIGAGRQNEIIPMIIKNC